MARITWFGHSTVLVELDGIRVLTDPVLGRRVAHLRRHHKSLDARELLPIDLVLVSHAHWDHLDVRTLARLGREQPVLVPRGAGVLLRRRGFVDVREADEADEIAVGDVTILVTHADHDASRGPLGVDAPARGYLVRGTRRIYFAGDTDVFAGMADFAGVDVALLPVSGWGRKVPAGHLDPERAAQAAALMLPGLVVPIHWGTYSPMHRRWKTGRPAEELREIVRGRALPVEVRTLEIGETLDV